MPHTTHPLLRALVAGLIASVTLGLAPAVAFGATTAGHTIAANPAAKTAPGQPRFGESGPGVLALQKAIMRNGFSLPGGASGVFDARTRRVLKTFQRIVGLKVTGVVDAATVRVLKLRRPAATAPSASTGDAAGAPAQAPARVFPLTLETLPARGGRGQSVITVQSALVAAGVSVAGGVDGVFGAATTTAIREFQRLANLPTTGVLDQRTAEVLGLVEPATPAVSSSDSPAAAGPKLKGGKLPSRGDRGRDVRVLQKSLVKAGIEVKGGVDGVFGGATSVAISKFQASRSLPATGRLDLRTAIELGIADRPGIQLQVFPVQGPCGYTNTWQAPRPGGRVHLGVDIIADEGNLLYAVADGTVTKLYDAKTDLRAGNGLRLAMSDGTYFFYGHLSRLADGITVGTRVRAGQVVGFLGKTGATTTPHLHFEVHPQGGDAIDPTDIVAAVDACDVTDPLPAPAG